MISLGVYAWITVNYLLKKIGGNTKESTAAVLDLGGGSTQIVFEPDFLHFESSQTELPPGDHRYDLVFSGHTYHLYQHSYDGFGLMQSRKKVVAQAVSDGDAKSVCMKKDAVEHVDSASGKIKITGTAGSFGPCNSLIANHLFESESNICPHEAPLQPCSFAGVYMPVLEDTFISSDIYAFSYFYDMYADPFNATSSFIVGDLKKAAERVCGSRLDSALESFSLTNPFWCSDLGYMYNLLHVGYDLPHSRVLKTAKKLNGVETGWALGLAIRLLDELRQPGKSVCRA